MHAFSDARIEANWQPKLNISPALPHEQFVTLLVLLPLFETHGLEEAALNVVDTVVAVRLTNSQEQQEENRG